MPRLPANKLAHATVHYGKGMAHAHCSICRRYIAPTEADPKPHCTLVHDPIGPGAWCDRFEKQRE